MEKFNTGGPLVENIGKNLRLVSYPHALEIRKLAGYSNGEPMWRERLGVYHPVTSELTRLEDDAVLVYDACKNGSISTEDISNTTGLNSDRVQDITEELQSRMLLLAQGQEVDIVFHPQFLEEAEVYIETTEACNFGCSGCATGVDRYESGQARSLDTETLKVFLTSSVRSAQEKGIGGLRFKWAGGESLLPISLKLIREAQATIRGLEVEYPSIKLSQVVLTNGSHLSAEVVEELKGWNMHVSVSLWGIGDKNDKARGVRREKDKYPNIIKGIQRLHEAGISYNIHHVVTPDNAVNFSDFVRAMWDTEDESFVGKDWEWVGDRGPIPVGISFFRPQTEHQLKLLKEYGYGQMVSGLQGGFEVILDLITRGLKIQPLDKIDYLQLFGVVPTVCGSGFNYIAAGPRGVASCHEALFSMSENLDTIRAGSNLIDIANIGYAGERQKLIGINMRFPDGGNRAVNETLALHGGTGCPRTIRAENNGALGNVSSIAYGVYAKIVEQILSLETMRRLTENNIN